MLDVDVVNIRPSAGLDDGKITIRQRRSGTLRARRSGAARGFRSGIGAYAKGAKMGPVRHRDRIDRPGRQSHGMQ